MNARIFDAIQPSSSTNLPDMESSLLHDCIFATLHKSSRVHHDHPCIEDVHNSIVQHAIGMPAESVERVLVDS